jgi:hypothetical protein
MFVAYVKDEDRMLFASEYMMMVWLAQRNGIALEDKIIDLAPGFLYQFDVDNPREFKKVQAPSFRTRPKHEVLFEQLEKIFSTVRKETTPADKGAKVIHLPHDKKQERQNKKDKKKGAQYVTAEEVRISKALEVHGQVVDIISLQHVPSENEVWGVTKIGTDEFACVMRNVDKSTYDVWSVASGVQGKVVGAQSFDSKGAKEAALIISRNVNVEEEPELTALARGVGSSLAEFMTERNNERGRVH